MHAWCLKDSRSSHQGAQSYTDLTCNFSKHFIAGRIPAKDNPNRER